MTTDTGIQFKNNLDLGGVHSLLRFRVENVDGTVLPVGYQYDGLMAYKALASQRRLQFYDAALSAFVTIPRLDYQETASALWTFNAGINIGPIGPVKLTTRTFTTSYTVYMPLANAAGYMRNDGTGNLEYGDPMGSQALGDHSDCLFGSLASGHVVQWNGSKWINGYQSATNILSGTLPSGRLVGTYDTITRIQGASFMGNGIQLYNGSGSDYLMLFKDAGGWTINGSNGGQIRYNTSADTFTFLGLYSSVSFGYPQTGWGSPSAGTKSLLRGGSATASNCSDVLAELILRLESIGFIGA